MTTKAKRCTLGRPVPICRDTATYSERNGLFCDRHGQALHDLRRGEHKGPCRCGHCLNRAELRRRGETVEPVDSENDTTEVD